MEQQETEKKDTTEVKAAAETRDNNARDNNSRDSRDGGNRGYGDRRGGRGRDRDHRSEEDKEFVEKLVTLNRTAKVVKGGRRYSFSALTVVGDKKGRVGFGFGKANDVTEAIKKSIDRAKRNLIVMPVKNGTIPHDMIGKYKSSSVLIRPACPGTGIIAGGAVRAIMDAAGATDIISKSLGSSASVNVVRATFNAISKLMNAKTIASGRGKTLDELWG
jgi:small subunit ribosomal protein S5